ncbi:MAG: DUF2141 domain-containing protein [Pseudomonadota bacterium]
MTSTARFCLHSLAVAAMSALFVVSAGSAYAADINVTVDGLANDQGQVLVGLYNQASEFPKGKRIEDKITPAAKGAVTVVFKDVPAGQYALSAFQDVNKNRRLDANMQGIPTEPIGASRDARGRMGPPTFDDAVFTVGSAPLNLTIHLK